MLASTAVDLLLQHQYPYKLRENNCEYTHIIVACADGKYYLPMNPKISYWEWHHDYGVKDQCWIDGTVLVHLITTKAKGTL